MAKPKSNSLGLSGYAAKLGELASSLSALSENIITEINSNRQYESVETLGKIVRKARKEQKVSLQVLAALSGVSLGTIQNIESGKGSPSLKNVNQVLNALGKKIWVL